MSAQFSCYKPQFKTNIPQKSLKNFKLKKKKTTEKRIEVRFTHKNFENNCGWSVCDNRDGDVRQNRCLKKILHKAITEASTKGGLTSRTVCSKIK